MKNWSFIDQDTMVKACSSFMHYLDGDCLCFAMRIQIFTCTMSPALKLEGVAGVVYQLFGLNKCFLVGLPSVSPPSRAFLVGSFRAFLVGNFRASQVNAPKQGLSGWILV